MTAAQARELREQILPAIDRARQALAEHDRPEFSDMTEVAKASGHGISTWHAWRRPNDPTSPKFFDLRDFARAVGLDVRLLTDAASTDPARSTIQVSGGTYALKPETTEVVRLMESLPDTARAAIRDAAFQKNGELQSDPLEPDGERTRSPLARQK